MNQPDKLIQLARQELPRLADNLIVPHDAGYRAFGRYQIERTGNLYRVLEHSQDRGVFGSTRTALSWCIADKYRQFSLAQQIRELDERSVWARENIEVRERLARRGSEDYKTLVFTKNQHRKAVKYQIDQELEKCISRAKYLQNRGFTNDTQRTSPSGPRKTSR